MKRRQPPRTPSETQRIIQEYKEKQKAKKRKPGSFERRGEDAILKNIAPDKVYHMDDLVEFLVQEGGNPGSAGPITSYMKLESQTLVSVGRGLYQMTRQGELRQDEIG